MNKNLITLNIKVLNQKIGVLLVDYNEDGALRNTELSKVKSEVKNGK